MPRTQGAEPGTEFQQLIDHMADLHQLIIIFHGPHGGPRKLVAQPIPVMLLDIEALVFDRPAHPPGRRQLHHELMIHGEAAEIGKGRECTTHDLTAGEPLDGKCAVGESAFPGIGLLNRLPVCGKCLAAGALLRRVLALEYVRPHGRNGAFFKGDNPLPAIVLTALKKWGIGIQTVGHQADRQAGKRLVELLRQPGKRFEFTVLFVVFLRVFNSFSRQGDAKPIGTD